MKQWRSGYVQVNGVRLHYSRQRNNGPTLVLAHGFSDDGPCWRPLAARLGEAYDLVLVDARGHGRSDGPEQGYNPATAAADLAGVIDALALPRPAVLGHSMGAITTLALAKAYPHLVRAILLEDPPPWWLPDSDEIDDRGLLTRLRPWLIDLKRHSRAEMMAAQRRAAPTWPAAEFGPWADAKLRVSFNVFNRTAEPRPDWPALIRQITCPTLLLTADPALGGLVTTEAAAIFCELLPLARWVHIPQAGHNIRREQPGRYLTEVQAFLTGVIG
jgi:pimeloyl-ACP methyl ester carboxylesterase